MQNIIYFNQIGTGYGWVEFSSNNINKFQENSLAKFYELKNQVEDVRTDIHKFCEKRPNTFTIRFIKKNNQMIFVYGIFIPNFKDDEDRMGVHFVHGLSIPVDNLFPTTISLLKLLELDSRQRFFNLIREIASIDATKSEDLIELLLSIFKTNTYTNDLHKYSNDLNKPRIKRLIHDIGGMSAYVWLMFAKTEISDSLNWAVYEKIERNKIVTECTLDGKQVLLSELLMESKNEIQVQNKMNDYISNDKNENSINSKELIAILENSISSVIQQSKILEEQFEKAKKTTETKVQVYSKSSLEEKEEDTNNVRKYYITLIIKFLVIGIVIFIFIRFC